MSDSEIILHALRDSYIELYKLLKIEGLAESGGQAKSLIDAGCVRVNGQVERRKRYKAIMGDVIVFDQNKIKIVETSDFSVTG